jgi:hypothetical protein
VRIARVCRADSKVRPDGWTRAISVSVLGLAVAVCAFIVQTADSPTIDAVWDRINGIWDEITGDAAKQKPSPSPSPPHITPHPYAMNTAELPRKAVQIKEGGLVEQTFTPSTKHLDHLR